MQSATIQHSLQIPDVIWTWAAASTGKNQGPATFLRNVLLAAMTTGVGLKPEAEQREGVVKEDRRPGKGLHAACYDKLVTAFRGDKHPMATPWEAERTTICPRCRKAILPGDQIVVTSIAEWTR